MPHPSNHSPVHRPLLAAVALAVAAASLGSCGPKPPVTAPSTSSLPAPPPGQASATEPGSAPSPPIGRNDIPPAASPLDFRPPRNSSAAISSARDGFNGIESRVFQNLTAGELEELQSLVANYHSSTGSGARLEAIDALSEFYSKDILAFVSQALDDKDPAVRQAALELLAGTTSTDVLPVAEKALRDGDAYIRAAAASAVARVPDPSVVPLFKKGIADSSDIVRYAFLDASAHVNRSIQNPVLESALRSESREIKSYALVILEQNISSANFGIIIDALATPDEQFREEVSLVINNLVQQEFESAGEARHWWDANRDRYDSGLFLKSSTPD